MQMFINLIGVTQLIEDTTDLPITVFELPFKGKFHLLPKYFEFAIKIGTVPVECGWYKGDMWLLRHDFNWVIQNNLK